MPLKRSVSTINTKIIQEVLSSVQLIDSVTTDYGSCLDHNYCGLPMNKVQKFGTLESYYSDHKPLYILYHT
jgi:hypothetical protein